MSQSEEELAQFIETILGNDNQLRKSNELLMQKLLLQNPNDFIMHLLNLISNHPNSSIRSFCAVSIRKHLSFHSEKNFSNVWSILTPFTKAHVKQTLFAILSNEQSQAIRHQVCDAIGEISSGLIDPEDGRSNEWAEIVPLIMNLLVDESLQLVESGLKILSTLFTFSVNVFLPYKEELVKIFKVGIENSNKVIQATSIEATANFLSNVGSTHIKNFEGLMPEMVEAAYGLLLTEETLGESALKSIEAIAESEPRFFRHNFPLLFSGMKKIFFEPNIVEIGKKKIATETLLALSERLPKLFRENIEYVQELLQILFYHMVDIEETISPSWERPEEGFNADMENDSDYEAVLFGTSSIDKLIASIGEKYVLPVLSVLVQTMMEKTDWRCKHSGIMALSQVGEYIDQNIEEISPIINLVLSYLDDPNPKLRYASCHCIGQIANDMKPLFQSSFHDTVFPALIHCLRDPIPRVHGHAAAAITNFVEGMSSIILKPYLTNLLSQFYVMLQTGISIVKENVISAVAATAEAAQEEFRYYYKKFVELLFDIIQTHKGHEYRQLNGIIVECLTLIVHSIGKEDSSDFMVNLLTLMMSLQENITEPTDPLKIYVLWGWQRLFMVLKLDILSCLERILTPLFKLLTISLTQPIDEEKEDDINPEISCSINLLNTLVTELQHHILPHKILIIQLILPIVTNNIMDEAIRKSSSQILPKLMEIIVKNEPSEARKWGVYFTQILLKSISEESEAIVIKEFIIVIKDCIGILGGYMSEYELSEFSKKIIKVIYDSDQRKDQEKTLNTFEDIDKDELDLLKDRIATEEDLQIAVAQLIGILFKTHRDHCVKFAEFLYIEVIQKVCKPNLSDKIHKLCLVIIDDMMEYLGRDMLKEKWVKMAEILMNYILDPCSFVREAACYGVGVFASQAKEEFVQYKNMCIERIIHALNIQQSLDEKQRIFFHCRDNIIAAIGKLIFYQSEHINIQEIIKIWVFNLPIKYEKFECYFQHELLASISLNKTMLIIPVIGQVIRIFADILDTRLINEKIKGIIGECLKKWFINEKNQEVVEIFKNLTPFQQDKIKYCIS